MNFTLYVIEECVSCVRIMNELKAKSIVCEIVFLNGEDAPENLLIIPALFEQQRLMAYGSDIIPYLLKQGSA